MFAKKKIITSRLLLAITLFLVIVEAPAWGAAAQKRTPLIDAVLHGDWPYGDVAALLNSGVDINEPDEVGNTALMYASNDESDAVGPWGRNDNLVDLLCSRKDLDINKKNSGGQTALMFAIAYWAPEENIKTILDAKADCSLRTHAGEKAIDLARERKWNHKVIHMLADYEAAQSEEKRVARIALEGELCGLFNERNLVAGHKKESLAALLGLFSEE